MKHKGVRNGVVVWAVIKHKGVRNGGGVWAAIKHKGVRTGGLYGPQGAQRF
jgi:hypothetical protein